jgi:enoyl-CoA hydratase/carnithine racemase
VVDSIIPDHLPVSPVTEICMPTSDPPSPHVVAERSPAGYLRVLLARPQQRNALDADMVRALMQALGADPAAVVLLGSTDPASFCAGADLTLTAAERSAVSDLLYECYELMVSRPGPVIAAIGGAAVGGGAQLAAAADLRIAGPAARMRWAGPPGMQLPVGAWVLPDLAGRGAAMDLTLTGRWVGAAEALALGIVNRIDDDPAQAAAGIAEALLARGPGALAAIKVVISAGGLLGRLHAEREASRAAWAQALAAGH